MHGANNEARQLVFTGKTLVRYLIHKFREFKQSTTAGATTAAMTEKVWEEYVSVRSLNFKFSETTYKETRPKEFKTSFI